MTPVKLHISALTIALVIGGLTVSAIEYLVPRLIPVDHYFKIHSVTVLDAKVGEEIWVVYERTNYRSFEARWTVVMRPLDKGISDPICTGGSPNYWPYSPDHPRIRKMDMQNYMFPNKPCRPPPGRYVLRTHWVLKNGLDFVHVSAPFEIVEE